VLLSLAPSRGDDAVKRRSSATVPFPRDPWEQRCRCGLTLTEMLLVIAIVGVLMAILLPALQSAREAARRAHCLNNTRQLALAMLSHASQQQTLPFGSRTWIGDSLPPGPGRYYSDQTWYRPILPFIEAVSLSMIVDDSVSFSTAVNLPVRTTQNPVFVCPADKGRMSVEGDPVLWPNDARLRGNYAVNWGNTNYGQTPKIGVPFLGAPFSYRTGRPLASVRDGLSATLLMAEVIMTEDVGSGWPGPLGGDFMVAVGGQSFNGWLPPNSAVFDEAARVCPLEGQYNGIPGCILVPGSCCSVAQQEQGTLQASYCARSKHPGGVSASLCDGSVRFVSDAIDASVWRALSTTKGAEPLDASAW